MKIGLTMSDNRFNTTVMSSLLESYRPTLQMMTAVERANKLSGMQANAMNVDDLMPANAIRLMAFIIKEPQH
jgi:hypothetical protein